jgi:hypothetical protein
MNFTFTWIMDKLGYMPKPAIKIDFQEWPFPPAKKEATKKVAKKTLQKATTRKPRATKKPK